TRTLRQDDAALVSTSYSHRCSHPVCRVVLTITRHPTSSFFFFNDTATTEIYTLSLHDALPISSSASAIWMPRSNTCSVSSKCWTDRKSTRLNSSHVKISYAVFCLKKKKTSSPMTYELSRTRSAANP